MAINKTRIIEKRNVSFVATNLADLLTKSIEQSLLCIPGSDFLLRNSDFFSI